MLYLDLTPVYDLPNAFRRARRKLLETREARYAEEMREYVERSATIMNPFANDTR